MKNICERIIKRFIIIKIIAEGFNNLTFIIINLILYSRKPSAIIIILFLIL